MTRPVRDAVLVGAARTPIGCFQGAFASVTAVELGTAAVREAIRRAGIEPDAVDEVILGMVFQAGARAAPARQAAHHAGVPDRAGALTINKMCGSGLKAVMLAAQAVRAGDADVVVAGGMENMSRAPHLLLGERSGYRLGHGVVEDAMFHDGFEDPYDRFLMGMAAEYVAEKHDVPREAQDAFALESHRRAVAARESSRFQAEIVPVEVPRRRGDPVVVEADEGPRADASLEALRALRPAFKPDGGTVTAGNSSMISDGAAAVVVMAEERASQLGCKVLARVRGYATSGRESKWVMMASVDAVEKLNAGIGAKNDDYERVEINEAFAAQTVAVTRACGFDPETVNACGGGVALGHPVGASGARILATLLHEMEREDKHQGLATLCLGGGNAVAMAVER